MKSNDEILTEVTETISGMYLRPQMYAGSTEAHWSAHTIECMLWQIHWFWALLTDRVDDLRKAKGVVMHDAGCVTTGLAATFRKANPQASPQQASDFVLQNWLLVSERVGIPLDKRVRQPRPAAERSGLLRDAERDGAVD